MDSLSVIERGLNYQQLKMEDYFKKHGINLHESWVFSSENRESIREITEFIKENTKDCSQIPYHRIWQYLMAYIVLQRKAREVLWNPVVLQRTPELQGRLQEMATFSTYAVGIYGKLLVRVIMQEKLLDLFRSITDHEIFRMYCDLQVKDVIYHQAESRRFIPAHALCFDHPNKALVITIRGTMSVFDCLNDLKANYEEYQLKDPFSEQVLATGKVHSGILLCGQNLAKELKPLVMQNLREDYKLVIVGHSLGAGTAALLSLTWLSDPDIMLHGFRTYAYAPPAVVSSELNLYLENYVTSCCFGHDIVPRLSFGTIRDICELIKGFEAIQTQDRQLKASVIVSRVFYQGNLDDFELLELYKELKSQMVSPKLEPPGYIYQVFQNSRHKDFKMISDQPSLYSGEFLEASFYKEVVFCKTMISDHVPDQYEKALKSLVLGDQTQLKALEDELTN